MPRLPELEIKEVEKTTCRDMVLGHHYSGRCPGIKNCWGLGNAGGRAVTGCIIYSIPASYTLCRGVCGPKWKDWVIELSRLVILTKRENAASFLIGGSLRRLGNAIVVSYADCNDHVGHVGYVYQATNWLYTGHGSAEPVWVHPTNGTVISYTRRHIDVKAAALGLHWQELVKNPQKGKHRYVTFTGDRRFRKAARASLRYKVLPYPKGETRRHATNQSTQ